MKTPVITSDDYVVYLENYQGMSIIHCDCYRWSKQIKQALQKDFNCLFNIHRKPIYAIHEMNDEKHLKFLKLFGFIFNNNFIGSDNKQRQLFVRNSHGD